MIWDGTSTNSNVFDGFRLPCRCSKLLGPSPNCEVPIITAALQAGPKACQSWNINIAGITLAWKRHHIYLFIHLFIYIYIHIDYIVVFIHIYIYIHIIHINPYLSHLLRLPACSQVLYLPSIHCLTSGNIWLPCSSRQEVKEGAVAPSCVVLAPTRASIIETSTRLSLC
jgi:hypothetical protein